MQAFPSFVLIPALVLLPLAAQRTLNPTESAFVQDVLTSGRYEVEVARMAIDKASDSRIKSFAQQLVSDHSAANQKLEEISQENGLVIPAQNSSRPHSHPDLSKLAGTEFDHAFVQQMVEGHEAGIAKFEVTERTATNPSLKQFITSTLPMLRSHLATAKSLNK